MKQDVYTLWDDQNRPYYKENDLQEYEEENGASIRVVCDITEPTLSVYKAAGQNTGKAVLIIPGGSYEVVALYHEGHDVAKVLAAQGITAGVLKYRLPKPASSDQPHWVPLSDARRALKLMSEKSDDYGIQKDKIGVLGFSAGSHLATVMSLWRSRDADENPSYSALIYGVTSLTDENQKWIEDSLYYRKLTSEEMSQNNLIDLVTQDTPPSFLVHAYDDDICRVQETTLYAQKLHEHQVPAEVHLFPKGGHGFGLGRSADGTDQWVQLFINWLKASRF